MCRRGDCRSRAVARKFRAGAAAGRGHLLEGRAHGAESIASFINRPKSTRPRHCSTRARAGRRSQEGGRALDHQTGARRARVRFAARRFSTAVRARCPGVVREGRAAEVPARFLVSRPRRDAERGELSSRPREERRHLRACPTRSCCIPTAGTAMRTSSPARSMRLERWTRCDGGTPSMTTASSFAVFRWAERRRGTWPCTFPAAGWPPIRVRVSPRRRGLRTSFTRCLSRPLGGK